jgi:two-component system response regulator AtoC
MVPESELAVSTSPRQRNERILIVEDEKLLRWSLVERLRSEGFHVHEAGDGRTGLAEADSHFFDLLLLDFRLPDTTGLDILRELRARGEDVVVIMMTAHSSVPAAVEAMRLGAYSYLAKPFDEDELVLTIDKALESSKLKRELAHLRKNQQQDLGLDSIVAGSPSMLRIFETAIKVAQSPATTVLITGESGTGKDLLAKAIHNRSNRRDGPFMNITCTTLTETLLESELFGHEKGAFTDAKTSKKGLFELAHSGTVFLDEIGDMPPALQSKLLRFLQEKTFKRVGGSQDVTVDVRVVAATNKDLEEKVKSGVFREDLYYRLNVIPIHLPPLRDRRGDVRLLAQSFVEQYNRNFRKNVKGIEEPALKQLEAYQWPGNVRELKNVIERAMILGGEEWLRAEDMPFAPVSGEAPEVSTPATPSARFLLPDKGLNLEDLEKDLLLQALERAHGVKTRAGALLGMNRDQIRYRMEKYNLQYPPV